MHKKSYIIFISLLFTYFWAIASYAIEDCTPEGELNGLYSCFQNMITEDPCTVESGYSATLESGQSISLKPGFWAKQGSTFTAKINFDIDDDGLPDWWEWEHFGSYYQDADDDISDMDGLTNIEEYQNQTDPKDSDTDSDEMPDGWEVEFGLDPIEDDADGDLDEDLYSNYVEYIAETDPDDVYSTPDPGYYHKYDPLGRLEKTVYLDDYEIEYEIVYDYDSVGNRTSREVR